MATYHSLRTTADVDSQHHTSITLTYHGPQAYLAPSSALLPHLLTCFSTQLPLRNLHWKPTSASSIRTIQQLPIALSPLSSSISQEVARQKAGSLVSPPSSLLDKPFVHLYFVSCTDAEVYRTSVRNDIRAWIASITDVWGTASGTSSGVASMQIAGSSSSSNITAAATGSFGSPALSSSSSSRPGTPQTRPHRGSSSAHATSGGGDDASPTVPISPAPPLEFLIVLVTAPDGFPSPSGDKTVSASNKVISSANSIAEKIRADFSPTKRDRVVHLTRLPAYEAPVAGRPVRPLPHSIDPTIFADLTTRLKECVMTTFDGLVSSTDDECRLERERERERLEREHERGLGRIQNRIWGRGFLRWIGGMECLAATFEGVGLLEEGMARYEDIEAVLAQALRDRAVPFTSIGGSSAGDDSALLLDMAKKPYRDLIYRNQISLFDLRCYLFAKRATLLSRMGRVRNVMNETGPFLNNVGLMLEAADDLPEHFAESWIYSSALDVVEQCQAWLIEKEHISISDDASPTLPGGGRGIDAHLGPAFNAAKAELLDLARQQMDRIGMNVGHLPRALPFVLSGSARGLWPRTKREDWIPATEGERDLPAIPGHEMWADGQAPQTAKAITRPELVRAIESRDTFDLQYTALTERILAAWMSGGRKRHVLFMRQVLGSLDFYRERFAQAYTTFVSLPEPYAADRWTATESRLLAKQLACHAALNKPRDRAWLSVVLAMLRTGHTAPGKLAEAKERKLDDVEIKVATWLDEDELHDAMRKAAATFEREVPITNYPRLAVKVVGKWASIDGDQDGCSIKVQAWSASKSDLDVDDVRVCLTSSIREQLWFTSGHTTLKPGNNDLSLFCPSPAAGSYILDVSQIRLSRVIFQYSSSRSPDAAVQVGVPIDGEALSVRAQVPESISLDLQRNVELCVFTGRNEVDKVELSACLASHTGQALVGLQDAKGESFKVEWVEERKVLVLENLASDTEYRIVLPLPEVAFSQGGLLPLSVTADYWVRGSNGGSRPSVRRQVRREQSLAVALPLGVNVQDFFRLDKLVSKFSISAGGNNTLRIADVELALQSDASEGSPAETGHGLKISAPPDSSKHVTVTPRSPASFAFVITKGASASSTSGASPPKMRFTLRYRTLLDEAQQLARLLFRQALQSKPGASDVSSSTRRTLERELDDVVRNLIDLPAYALLGSLRVGEVRTSYWSRRLRAVAIDSKSATARETLLPSLAEALTKARECGPGEAVRLLSACPEDGESAEGGGSSKKNRKGQEQRKRAIGVEPAWRTLDIPVDLPSVDVVNAVEMQLKDQTLVVGQPVQATISVLSTRAWSAPELDSTTTTRRRKVQMVCDVTADLETWLVSGPKRRVWEMDFDLSSTAAAAGEGESRHSFNVTLIPLREGRVLGPTIAVWPSKTSPSLTPPSIILPSTSSLSSEVPPSSARPGGDAGADQDQEPPSSETYTSDAARRYEVLPRRAWSTYSVPLPSAAQIQMAQMQLQYSGLTGGSGGGGGYDGVEV